MPDTKPANAPAPDITRKAVAEALGTFIPVSYTHLTLPTICSV